MHSIQVDHWVRRIHELIEGFADISFDHIHQELNMHAYFLSKNVIGPMDNYIFFEEFSTNMMIDLGSLYVF